MNRQLNFSPDVSFSDWRRWVMPVASLCVMIDAALVRFTTAGSASPWVSLGTLADAMLVAPLVITLTTPQAARSSWQLARYAMIGMAFASLALSTKILPEMARLRWMELAVGACFEFWLLRQVLRLILRSNLPVDEALQRAMTKVLGAGRLARIVAVEMLVWYYALFSWRREARSVSGERQFSHGIRYGGNGTIVAFACISLLEIVPAHFILQAWSQTGAWVATGLSLYGSLWLLGEYRAAVLRPTVLDAAMLRIRIGLVMGGGDIDVPVLQIARLVHHRGKVDARAPGVAQRVSIGGEPNLCLDLHEALAVQGHFGKVKQVTRVYLTLDEPQQLIDALALMP